MIATQLFSYDLIDCLAVRRVDENVGENTVLFGLLAKNHEQQ